MTTLGVLCCFALFICLTLLASFFLPSHLSLKHVHVLMRDEKEERSKQGQTNNKAKQHSTPNVHHDVACTYMYMLMRDEGRKKEVSTCT